MLYGVYGWIHKSAIIVVDQGQDAVEVGCDTKGGQHYTNREHAYVTPRFGYLLVARTYEGDSGIVVSTRAMHSLWL